jgi:isopropylmalate/homocitrate/citramalate synthase
VPDQVRIYDTTLRDGCQGAGISLSLLAFRKLAEGERLPMRDAVPV